MRGSLDINRAHLWRCVVFPNTTDTGQQLSGKRPALNMHGIAVSARVRWNKAKKKNPARM